MIYGRQPVLEWLEYGLPVRQIILSRDAGGKPIHDILHIAEKQKIEIKRMHAAKLDQIAGTEKHQNILAQVKLPPYAEIDDIFSAAEKKTRTAAHRHSRRRAGPAHSGRHFAHR